MFVTKLRFPISLAAATLIALASASGSFAHAEVGTFFFQSPVTDPTSLPECLPPELADIVGTQTGTDTVAGHFTALDSGFHVEGSEDLAYRVDFPDGRYIVGDAPARFVFNTSISGETVSTVVIREPRTIYDADGQPIGGVIIHALTHVSYRDVNGNGQPDPGEIRASVDRFFFTCS
jgi:hypothetical protein